MDTSEVQKALGAMMGKLEALERSNAALEARVALLDTQRPMAPSAKPAPANRRTADSGTDGQASRGGTTSRRMWLKRAAGAAMASVAAGAMLERETDTAEAHHGTGYSDIWADDIDAHRISAATGDWEAVNALNSSLQSTVFSRNAGVGTAVRGVSGGGIGVTGEGTSGIKGVSINNTSYGVYGIGVTGVKGESSAAQGTGVHGSGWVGVHGVSSTDNWAAVAGEHNGQGPGVSGRVNTTSYAATQGVNDGTGPGVRGWSFRSTGDGVVGQGKVGVRGKSSIAGAAAVVGEHSGSGTTSGYGGQFKGARAQVRLVPGATAGRPTSGTHAKGELYMDSAATLYVCTVGGTPGTWRRLTTTTA